jgi:succinate-acetate transporter protein
MATISAPTRPVSPRSAPTRSAPTRSDLQEADLEGRPLSPTTLNWGNSAPVALAAFGVTAFMLSMVNANLISPAVKPVVFAVALMFGGLTQLIAGIIQLRTGNTFSGVLFTGFGGFWLSLFAVGQWFIKAVPAAQTGHALGLFLYAFGIFALVMWVASFRTNAIVVLSVGLLVAAFFLLAAGNYGAHVTLIHWGGYLGLAAAACAFYLALSELCEVSYERTIFPVGSLARH